VLAYVGHQVTYMDKDEERVAELEEGRMPNYQPGLEERVNESARR
jgi:UDP-glucose 6-dehydrogenase